MKKMTELIKIRRGVDCTEEWLCLVGLKDQLLKTYRVKKDIYTFRQTGETVELHRHGMNYPNRGRVESFYIVMGDIIPTKVFKLVSKGDTYPDKQVVKEANKYVSDYLVSRLKALEKAPKEAEETLDIDDLEIVDDIDSDDDDFLTI